MTKPRNECYVWVTWLAKLMAGEIQCQWSPWFKSHYTSYAKAPSDFQQATWVVEHNKCLDALCDECSKQALSYFKENQNSFTVKRKQMAIGGKPDIVVLEKDSGFTIYDVKTGQSRNSDIVQVMLYMSFLPYSTSGMFRGKKVNGCVVYKDGNKTPIPHQAIDDAFKAQITHFLDILGATAEPKKIPSFDECKYCDITEEDCPEKVKFEISSEETPDLPM